MDAVMFIWRVNTTFKRWVPSRVAFMNAMFCLQIHAAYNKFLPNKKAYELLGFLLGYDRGEIPSHGRTDQVWGIDVDRLYFPLFVNGNHWVAVCVNIIEKKGGSP
uniref:Ubiquitin-like protease family profile domain-containing protein n=1 Tax=Brassica oleracea var. oleracea TaxID=109376 RepID=A0A0D2ZZ24_BRAOL